MHQHLKGSSLRRVTPGHSCHSYTYFKGCLPLVSVLYVQYKIAFFPVVNAIKIVTCLRILLYSMLATCLRKLWYVCNLCKYILQYARCQWYLPFISVYYSMFSTCVRILQYICNLYTYTIHR
jgi:hypothetical protein